MNRFLNNCKSSRLFKPFNNRKAISEEVNSGISFSTSLIVTLIALSVLLGLFGLFMTNAKEMQEKEKELRQQENDSISLNVESNPSMIVLGGFVVDC